MFACQPTGRLFKDLKSSELQGLRKSNLLLLQVNQESGLFYILEREKINLLMK